MMLKPEMLTPVRRVTRLDLALVALLGACAIGVPIANIVRIATHDEPCTATLRIDETAVGCVSTDSRSALTENITISTEVWSPPLTMATASAAPSIYSPSVCITTESNINRWSNL